MLSVSLFIVNILTFRCKKCNTVLLYFNNKAIILYMRTIEFVIESEASGKQIRDFLRDFGVSCALLTKLKKDPGGILKNGLHAKSIERLECGDRLTINIRESGTPPAYSGKKINVIYEDEDILAVNKPAGMPVHESRNHRGDTLSNAVAPRCGGAFRAVYRLDRDTSGIVLIAKNELAAAKLAGKIKKDYYAVVCGIITESGVVDCPIRREAESIIKRCAAPDGERAVTKYEPQAHSQKYTLLKLNLKTGRTHQIRVHMAHIGYPLAGDDLYGGECTDTDRQALHCRDIYFTHPITNEKMHLCCDFPPDFTALALEMI